MAHGSKVSDSALTMGVYSFWNQAGWFPTQLYISRDVRYIIMCYPFLIYCRIWFVHCFKESLCLCSWWRLFFLIMSLSGFGIRAVLTSESELTRLLILQFSGRVSVKLLFFPMHIPVKPSRPKIFFVGRFLDPNSFSLISLRLFRYLFFLEGAIIVCAFQGIWSFHNKLLNLLA